MAITVRWACDTRQGPRSRNEDSAQVEPDLAAAILADGMGGAAGGKEASTLAVATAAEMLHRHLPSSTPAGDVPDLLCQLVGEVNQRVFAESTSVPGLLGMGSTLVVLVLRGGSYCCANVGDSRAYLVRGCVLTQISKDHSLVQERVDAGLITPAEAATQPDRNVLTRAIGTTAAVTPHLAQGEVCPGDVFVLTSDGVHGAVTATHLLAAGEADDPAVAARRLVETALAQGTRDNATAAVGQVAAAAASAAPGGLDQVLAYAPPRGAAPTGGAGGGNRWLLAGLGLLLVAVALVVLALR